MAYISSNNISKKYGNFSALSDINIDIQEGEFLTLLGPSGSGKTTFLMILAGFVDASTGILSKNGVDITHVPAEKRNFGMVFQGYALFPHLTVRQNIEYPLRIRGITKSEQQSMVNKVIETVGLSEHSEKKPSQLSGGQQQRVALARSLVFKPDMLLLDEPLSALDRNMREQLRDELKRIHKEIGTTFVFVTHDQSEALALSDNIAIFNQGTLAQLGSPQDIYDEPASRFVAEFLGQVNIIPLDKPTANGTSVQGNVADTILTVPALAGTSQNTFINCNTCSLSVRPEHLIISEEKPSDSVNVLKAKIVDLTYQGSHTNLTFSVADDIKLFSSIPSTTLSNQPKPGEEIWVSWPVDKGRVLVK